MGQIRTSTGAGPQDPEEHLDKAPEEAHQEKAGQGRAKPSGRLGTDLSLLSASWPELSDVPFHRALPQHRHRPLPQAQPQLHTLLFQPSGLNLWLSSPQQRGQLRAPQHSSSLLTFTHLCQVP